MHYTMDLPEGLSEYASIPGDENVYTMRSLFERYRDGGGICWVEADPPEMSVTQDTGEITCMTRMACPIGMPFGGIYVGLEPAMHNGLQSVVDAVNEWIADSIDSGNLWCPPNSVRVVRGDAHIWRMGRQALSSELSDALTRVELSDMAPLSISSVHAALESEKAANVYAFERVYPYPRTTVPSTGLFGTSHNNSFVDMSPFEEEKKPDMEMRTFRDEHVGYICAPHTSHSYEAGKSRRVTQDVYVRLLDYKTYSSVDGMRSREVRPRKGDALWTVFCVGQVCKASAETVRQLCIYHRMMSIGRDPSFGLYIKEDIMLCIICVAPGVLTKLCSNGVWADNSNAHKSDRVRYIVQPYIATSGRDFHRACLSGHYNYIPFVEHNAAVRTSISSAQILQAVCLPWCPATAAVSPVSVFKPVVTTKTYARVMARQEATLDLGSYLPGETVCILYHNLPLNYEDAVLISRRYVENGGFATLSICRYLLPASDYVPPPGSQVCSKLCKWWKSRCQSGCKHTKEHLEASNAISPFGPPTGTIMSRRILKSGEQSVKVRSYEVFQSGNKISTFHGQKGVAAGVVDMEDMPVCYAKDGTTIIPDVIMAVSSIVTRQTLGQVYESGASLERIKDPSLDPVIPPDATAPLGEDVRVMDGRTGEFYTTALHGEAGPGSIELKETVSTIGFVRVCNQSQMTRERHFTSHRSMTSRTLRTPVRRSRGGALKEGEMEVQATVAAGLVSCVSELRRRGDEVLVLVCAGCQRLRLLHSCTEDRGFIEVTLPYDTVVLDCVSKIVYNSCFVYSVEPDI